MHIQKILNSIISIALGISILSPAVFAVDVQESNHMCDISVLDMIDDQPIPDVEFQIYRVADYHDGVFSWVPPYDEYSVTLDMDDKTTMSNLAETLYPYIRRDNIQATATKKTGEDGTARFTSLQTGIYLITSTSHSKGGYRYQTIPVIVLLPHLLADQTLSYSVDTEVKHTAAIIPSDSSTPTTISRHALKIWDDDDYEEARPSAISVQLLKDGVIYDTATLSEHNGWRTTWSRLDASAEWTVIEPNVPDNYTVSMRQEGVTFVITNSYLTELDDEEVPTSEKPIDIEDDKLPQTGQPIVPIISLAVAGTAFAVLGVYLRRKDGANIDE